MDGAYLKSLSLTIVLNAVPIEQIKANAIHNPSNVSAVQ